MSTIAFIFCFLFSTSLLAADPLNCSPQTALRIISAMPVMGATSYAPGRYAFIRSTCGEAEQGLYCLGRDYDEKLHDPVRQQAARAYQQGLIACGVPRDARGRWVTGEIRCRGDREATCRIFPPNPAPANWPSATQRGPEERAEVQRPSPPDYGYRSPRGPRSGRVDWRDQYDDYEDSLRGRNSREEPAPYPEESEHPGSPAETIQRVKAAAIQAADDAFARNNNSQTRQIKAKLQSANIRHSNQTPCDSDRPGLAGCAEVGGSRVWLTDVFLQLGPEEQLHTMIHEASHLIGIGDECACDRLTRKIMGDAGIPLSGSGYDQMCGN